MARTLKTAQVEAQAQNDITNTASTDWTKFQRKAVRSFLKRAKANGIVLVINGDDKSTVINARELNSLLRTIGIMSAQQRDYIEGKITLDELVDKLDTSFGYWLTEDDDYSNAE